MAFKRFEDVIAWQHARTLTNEILSITSSMEAFKKEPELCRRLQNTALDVQGAIARSFGYHDSAHFLEGLRIAMGHAEELRSLLFSAADRECINLRIFERLTRSIQTCSLKTQELITFVKQQLKAKKLSTDQARQPASGMRNGVSIQYPGTTPQTAPIRQSAINGGPEQPTSPLIHGIPTDDEFFSDDFDIVSGSGHGNSENSQGRRNPSE